MRRKLQQLMTLFLALSLIVASLPGIAMAQEGPISATSVRGEINEQFGKHYLTLRSTGPGEMQLTMLANPNDNQFLHRLSGFSVFNEDQFAAFVRVGGVVSSKENTANGVEGRNADGLLVKRAPVGTGTYTVIVYNDSDIPMEYTLTVTGGVLVDESGEQVVDASAPRTPAPVSEEEAPAPTPAPAVVVEEEAAAEEEAAEETAEVVTETAAPTDRPRIVRVSTLEGELNEQFAKHFYALSVNNPRSALSLSFSYDPQDRSELDGGLNVYVLNESQFRRWSAGGPGSSLTVNNTLTLELERGPGKVKSGTIQQTGGDSYVVIVDNNTEVPATYSLSVTNGVLVDDAGQSLTAQALGSITPATDAAEGATAATTTTTTAATAATPAAPAANAITVPGSYTVVAGDTLGTIARRAYGEVQLFAQICAYNNIADCNRIEIGDVIELPARAELGTGATAAPAATTAPAAATPTPAATTAPATTAPATTAPAPTATPTPVAEEEAEASATGTIVEAAGGLSSLGTLGLLLDLLDLEQDQNNNIKAILNSAGPYTVFAPTDTAFTALPQATLNNLIANPAELAAVLKYHIVLGNVLSSDLSDGMVVETLNGALLEVRVAANGTVTVGGATVTQADLRASNGVVHVINTVLIPPAR